MNALKTFWHTHVQKTLGSILGALAGIDLVTALAGYQADITALLGAKVYAGIRCICAVAIVWRAVQSKREVLPTPDPGAARL